MNLIRWTRYVFIIESLFYGNNYICGLVLYMLLLYLFLKGGNIYHNILIRYTILTICIIYNPVVIYFCHKILGGVETEVRLFYLLPIFPICAYGITNIVCSKDKLDYKALILFVVLIIICGKTFWSQNVYKPAENIYKIPQEVMYVCDVLEQDDSYKKVLAPNELLDSIRQYDSRIEMCYGRYGAVTPFAVSFSDGTISEEEFKDYMQTEKFNCIIYNRNDIEMIKMFNEYGYMVIGETEKYFVLKK